MPTLASGMVPKMGACLRGGQRRRPAGHRRRRPGAARRAARDLHRRGRRHPGAARRRDQDPHAHYASSAEVSRRDDRRRTRYAAALMNTFGPPQLVLERGEGAYVWDADGQRYLDLLGGIAVNALGHAHPALVDGGHRAAGDPRPRLELLRHRAAGRARRAAARAARRAPAAAVFFTNSGTEANEAALKLTRRTGRTHVVAAEGASTAAPWARSRSPPRRPTASRSSRCPGDVTFVPYGDADALAAAVTDADRRRRARADPGRGRRGRRRRPATWRAAREITREHGALLWLDEVQTGIGRTGAWFAHQRPSGVDARTWSPSPRGSAAASRSARCIGARRRRHACSSPATTAPPSAATRSPARPRSPSRHDRGRGLLDHATKRRASSCATACAEHPR